MRALFENKRTPKILKEPKFYVHLYNRAMKIVRRGTIYEQLPMNMLCCVGVITKKFIKQKYRINSGNGYCFFFNLSH